MVLGSGNHGRLSTFQQPFWILGLKGVRSSGLSEF
jgi:hypothetical protein